MVSALPVSCCLCAAPLTSTLCLSQVLDISGCTQVDNTLLSALQEDSGLPSPSQTLAHPSLLNLSRCPRLQPAPLQKYVEESHAATVAVWMGSRLAPREPEDQRYDSYHAAAAAPTAPPRPFPLFGAERIPITVALRAPSSNTHADRGSKQASRTGHQQHQHMQGARIEEWHTSKPGDWFGWSRGWNHLHHESQGHSPLTGCPDGRRFRLPAAALAHTLRRVSHHPQFCGIVPDAHAVAAHALQAFVRQRETDARAATRIAATFRMWRRRTVFLAYMEQLHVRRSHAATLIQAVARMYSCRSSYQATRHAAKQVARFVERRWLARQLARRMAKAVRHHNKKLFALTMRGFTEWALSLWDARQQAAQEAAISGAGAGAGAGASAGAGSGGKRIKRSMLLLNRAAVQHRRMALLRRALRAMRRWLRATITDEGLLKRSNRMHNRRLCKWALRAFSATVARHKRHKWRMASVRLNVLPLHWRNARHNLEVRRAANAMGEARLVRRCWRRWIACVVLRRGLVATARAHFVYRGKKRKWARRWFRVWQVRVAGWQVSC